MLTIYGNIYLYFSKPLTIEFRRQKKKLCACVLYFRVDIICINSENSNEQAKINNTSRKVNCCLSVEHKLLYIYFFHFFIYEKKKTLLHDRSEIGTCPSLAHTPLSDSESDKML